MRFCLVIALLLILPVAARSQAFKMEPGPKSPQESLQCIKLRPGFKAELMVAEPLVESPIAFAWGPDGKFWVVEMGDYPLGVDGKGKPGGRIKILEKSRPDGPYDKMTLFMDGLGFPTGVLPYRNGVLVTCAPDIFYAECSKGTGKADKKVVLFTGFVEGNQQHRVNGLTWGLDNWIYGANGDSGGKIKSLVTGKVVDIRGRDFRFKVESGEFETQSGQSQFGRCRDDWGNWFGNNNSNPMFHYVLDDHYLKRNPNVLYPDVRINVSVNPGASQVYPISKPLPRFNSPNALNHFTSACSTIIYRDMLFGKEFEGNSFVSEPVHNLIHREIMEPKGITFTSQRAHDEQTSEFLASSDNWFRPTMIQTGPDGALWVADMYRYVIEHPQWIPKEWQQKLDLRAGQDKGRIYRVYPVDMKPRPIVRMDKMKVEELVALLESPNGSVRDMAQQTLVEKTKFSKALTLFTCGLLDALVKKSKSPQARLHALHYSDANEYAIKWSFARLAKFLVDPNPAIRKHGVKLILERHVNQDDAYILDYVEKTKDDQVLQQLAYSLGEAATYPRVNAKSPEARLARLLCDSAEKPYLLAAGLSSISKSNWEKVLAELLKQERIPTPLFVPILKLAKVFGGPLDAAQLFTRQLDHQDILSPGQALLAVGEMLNAMDKNELSLDKLLEKAGAKQVEKTRQRLHEIHDEAAKIVVDPKAAMSEKRLAIRLLACGFGDDRADNKILLLLLTPRTPDDIQSAVIAQLGRKDDPRTVSVLLTPWRSFSPLLRGQVLDTLLSRAFGTIALLEALKKQQIPANEIDAIRRQRLLHHKDEAVRTTAAKIFAAPSNQDRGKIVSEYWVQLPDKTDLQRGAKLFAKSCATCHQLNGVGQQVGPDLASVGDKSPQGLLTAILDPNRAVETRYVNYTAVTRGGLTFTGILTGETSTNITLAGPDGKKHELLRNELEELASTGKSMMPEGLEKDLSPQDLADVIAHVRSNQQTEKPKQFPGNTPKTLSPDKQGVLLLSPQNAFIYGPKIVLEPQHGNLGWWSSPHDRAVWSVTAPSAGKYLVTLEYACANDSAGNLLAIRTGTSHVLHRVGGTGSWDNYRWRIAGTLELSAGTQEIALRSEGTLRGALIDLKAVKLTPQ